MKHRNWAYAALVGLLLPAVIASANYNTFFYQSYTDSNCSDQYSTQWVNWDDWVDEMNDMTSCRVCQKDPALLWHEVAHTGNDVSAGLGADLIAIDTHGYAIGQGSSHEGYIKNRSCDDIRVRAIEPVGTEAEIFLMNVCDIFTRDTTSLWYTFRNMFSYGAHVAAGCYGTCWIVDAWTNTTWNEMGDEIADSQHTIKTGWWSAHDLLSNTDTVTIVGLGKIGAGDCATKATGVKYQDRDSFTVYYYEDNRPIGYGNNDFEICGYWVEI